MSRKLPGWQSPPRTDSGGTLSAHLHAHVTRHLVVRAPKPSNKETALKEPGSEEARDTERPSKAASKTFPLQTCRPGLRDALRPTVTHTSSPRRTPFKSEGKDSAGVKKLRFHPRPPSMAGNADRPQTCRRQRQWTHGPEEEGTPGARHQACRHSLSQRPSLFKQTAPYYVVYLVKYMRGTA